MRARQTEEAFLRRSVQSPDSKSQPSQFALVNMVLNFPLGKIRLPIPWISIGLNCGKSAFCNTGFTGLIGALLILPNDRGIQQVVF